MLKLTRRVGEKIIIGEDIVVEIEQIRRSQVRVAVSAPLDVQIYREEVKRRIDRERKP